MTGKTAAQPAGKSTQPAKSATQPGKPASLFDGTYSGSRAMKSSRGREEKKHYLGVKAQIVLEEEPKNHSKLFFVASGGKWYKLFGHSALLFHYAVAKEIGLSSNLRADTDYDYKSEDGMVSISNMTTVDEALQKHKITLVKKTADCWIYNLGTKYTDADIEALKAENAAEWSKMNMIVRVKNPFPELFGFIKDYPGQIYFATRSLDAYLRTAVALPMLRRASDMVSEYNAFCNSETTKPSEYFDRLIEDTHWILSQINVLGEMRQLSMKETLRLMYHASKIIREAEKCRVTKR